MSEQTAIHRLRLARQVTMEAITDSGAPLIDELVSALVAQAREEFDRAGLTLTDFKLSFSPYEATLDEIIRRPPSALAELYALVLVAQGSAQPSTLASDRSL